MTISLPRISRISGSLNASRLRLQKPMTSLNPVFTIGNQIQETLGLHRQLKKKEALERSIDLLRMVGIPRAEVIVSEYPHLLSGGMRQRVMIAMA